MWQGVRDKESQTRLTRCCASARCSSSGVSICTFCASKASNLTACASYAPQRSRLSVLSSEGTPIKGDALTKSTDIDFSPLAEREERDADAHARAADAHARGGGDKEEEEVLLDSGCWAEHAPERGEEGENYYWHKQVTLTTPSSSNI